MWNLFQINLINCKVKFEGILHYFINKLQHSTCRVFKSTYASTHNNQQRDCLTQILYCTFTQKTGKHQKFMSVLKLFRLLAVGYSFLLLSPAMELVRQGLYIILAGPPLASKNLVLGIFLHVSQKYTKYIVQWRKFLPPLENNFHNFPIFFLFGEKGETQRRPWN